jgi:hypothetical protein
MPILGYDGNTFVAFVDLCGFKELMRSEDKAWRALDALYSTGYRVLRGNEHDASPVEGLFVSDSGILFVRGNLEEDGALSVVTRINRTMLDADLMLSTSIAYGHFRYQERIEFVGIEKNPIYGDAYLSAYFDNTNGSPRIQPGQCRLVKSGLPTAGILDEFHGGQFGKYFRTRPGDPQHYYFYWNVDHPDEIDGFEDRYQDSYRLKYQGMLRALKSR